ncbi:MAG: SpoIIE family protein phosphatase [Flavobacteriales bacterium]
MNAGSAAMIAFGYLLFTGLNLLACKLTGRMETCMALQVLLSLLLPFLFQSAMGGITRTGAVMIWSFIPLAGALSFQRRKAILAWAVLDLVLIITWALFDPITAGPHGEPMQASTYRTFLGLNLGACQLIIFGLALYFVRKQGRIRRDMNTIRQALSDANNSLSDRDTAMQQSLSYARSIQRALVHSPAQLEGIAKELIVLDKPVQQVGGDMLWVGRNEHCSFVALIDCTGHGVPGSLLGMLARGILGEVVQHPTCTSASSLIHAMQTRMDEHLDRERTNNKDGVELAALCFDHRSQHIGFAGCGMGSIIIRPDGAELIRGERPLTCQKNGWVIAGDQRIDMSPGTSLCLFTDGITDQHGGPDGRKLGSEGLRDLLCSLPSVQDLDHATWLDRSLEAYQGAVQQVDDRMLVLLDPDPAWYSTQDATAA